MLELEFLNPGRGIVDEYSLPVGKKPGHGTGLGLSISLSIIKEHNGTIKARAATGKGARFTVRLPVAQEQDDMTGSGSP